MKLVLIIAVLLFGGCKKIVDPADDNGSGSGDDSGETVSPPENIAGTYLTCGAVSEPTDARPEADVGCRLAHHESGKKIDLAKFADNWKWTYSQDSAAKVEVAGAPTNSPWHVIYKFKGSNPEQARQAVVKTYVNLPIKPKGEPGVEVGAPLTSIMKTAYSHGDLDGDGYLDLFDRRPDGSVSMYFYDPKAAGSAFPFKEEKPDKLNWTFANYFILDYTADRKDQDYLVARHADGRFNYLLYERGKEITDSGASEDFMKQFTHYVIGRFNSYMETMLVRKVDDRLVHFYLGSEGKFVPGAFDDIYYLAGDFNKDGYDDLFTLTVDGKGMYRQNTTAKGSYDPTFAPPVAIGSMEGYTHFVTGDFDGDGVTDLMGRTTQGSLTFFRTVLKDGKPSWDKKANVSTGWDFDDYFATDWNKNGKSEFMGRSDGKALKSFELP